MTASAAAIATPTPALNERFERLPIGDVLPSKTNPRTHFDEAYLAELAGSIAEKDLINPILVRPMKTAGKFEIVAGECRYRASKIAKRTDIASVIRDYSDEQVLELQLIENIHRKDLTALEQAVGYRALIKSNPDKHSAESIASRIGMSVAWVWDRLKLNDLIPEAKKLLEQDRMSVGHAIVIARLKPEDQKRAIDPGDNNGYGDKNRGGLWTEDTARFDEMDEKDETPKNKYDGLKPRSIRELESWIADYVRFDVKHMAQAVPLQFETVAQRVEAAESKPGRGRKVIAITLGHFTQPDARDDKERTYGERSWKRADGTKKTTRADGWSQKMIDSPTCEYSVLGVVAVGESRGEAFDVCIARDKCEVHWKKEIAEKLKNQKLRESGKPKAAAKREAAAEARDRREEEKEARARARFDKFAPALKKASLQAAEATKALTPALFAAVVKAFGLPPKTTHATLERALLMDAVESVFQNMYWLGGEPNMVAWAKLLGVDVKACEPKSDDGATPVKKAAKKGKGK